MAHALNDNSLYAQVVAVVDVDVAEVENVKTSASTVRPRGKQHWEICCNCRQVYQSRQDSNTMSKGNSTR